MINQRLLSRILTQPLAMRDLDIVAMTQIVLAGEHPQNPQNTQRVVTGHDSAAANGPSTGGSQISVPGLTVIPVTGCIGRGWDYFDVTYFGCVDVDDLIAQIEASPVGQPVVLWFRSPGGIVTGVPEMAAYLRSAGKTRRILAFTDDLCCSAAYWLASQCEAIHATPTARIGSIGVYLAFYDYTEYLAKNGVKLELFKAGRMKAMGLPGNPLSEEESTFLQDGVLESYRQFTGDVTRIRAIDKETMQGQSYSGKATLTRNLCDKQWQSAQAFFAAFVAGKV